MWAAEAAATTYLVKYYNNQGIIIIIIIIIPDVGSNPARELESFHVKWDIGFFH